MVTSSVRELSIREGREITAQYPPCYSDQCLDEVQRGGRAYACTREVGHDGPHVAHTPGPSASATWERA